MSTGDLKNNLKKLQAAVRAIKYEKDIDVESLSKGVPGSFLPIYHFAFIDYSRFIAEKISELNIELYGKADLRFVEAMYKVLRELFSFKPALTKDQFFSNGFAEKKIIMCTEILNRVRSMHLKLAPKPRAKTAPTNMTSNPMSNIATSAVNHKFQPVHPTASKTSKTKRVAPVKEGSSPVARNATYCDIANLQHQVAPAVHAQNEAASPRVMSDITIGAPFISRDVHVSKPKPAETLSGDNILPEKPVSQTMSQTYNPTAYEADEESIDSYKDVKVVSLNSDTSEEHVQINMRPIDMIAKTPGRPLVECHVQRNTEGAGETTNLLLMVEQKLTRVAENVSHLVDRVKVVEEKMTLLESQHPNRLVSEETMENVLARLTLLENGFRLIKAQSKPPIARDEQSYLDSLERHSTVNEPPNAVQEPNPRYIVQSFSEGQNASPAMTSTPVEPVQRHKDPSNKENAFSQAERIKAMLKNTENMLQITVESPAKPNSAGASGSLT